MEKKEAILKVLEKEPNWLTIQEISRRVNISRFATTVYLHELLGEGKVLERKIGAYKLFKLKEAKDK